MADLYNDNATGTALKIDANRKAVADLTTIDLLSQHFERYSAQSSTWSGDMNFISFASSSSRWAGVGCM